MWVTAVANIYQMMGAALRWMRRNSRTASALFRSFAWGRCCWTSLAKWVNWCRSHLSKFAIWLRVPWKGCRPQWPLFTAGRGPLEPMISQRMSNHIVGLRLAAIIDHWSAHKRKVGPSIKMPPKASTIACRNKIAANNLSTSTPKLLVSESGYLKLSRHLI